MEPLETLFLEMRHSIEKHLKKKASQAEIAVKIALENGLPLGVPLAAERAYKALPASVQNLLIEAKERMLFLAACGATVNLPWELIRTPDVPAANGNATWEYVGLQRQLPRLHSLQQLPEILQRQPEEKNTRQYTWRRSRRNLVHAAPKAIVVGDPNANLAYSHAAAEHLETLLRARGFDLMPEGDALKRNTATADAVTMALKRPFVLWIQIGHGGGDASFYLKLAGEGKLYPQAIANQKWLQHPIVHYACCVVGRTLAQGGGRFDGHPTAALLAGSSCVLSSTQELFDAPDAEFCARLYQHALDRDNPQMFGAALLATRREMADAYKGNPLVWAQYALWGNPGARLIQLPDA